MDSLMPEINTPEKPIQLPRRSRNRGVALSMGLRSSDAFWISNESPASAEEEIGASSGRTSTSKVKLPEKCEMLCEFFDSMDSSIRLLRLTGPMTSFWNICTTVLIVCFCCQSQEVPQEQLPYPFSKEKQNLGVIEPAANSSTTTSSTVTVGNSTILTNLKQISVTSYLPGSFLKRFFARFSNSNLEKTELLSSIKENLKHDDATSVVLSPMKGTSRPPVLRRALRNYLMPATASKCENSEGMEKMEQMVSNTCNDGTPAKQVSTPLRLMTATPDTATPKRHRTSDICDSPLTTRSSKRLTQTKLFMTPTKGAGVAEEEYGSKSSSIDADDVLNSLPESLLQSIKEKEKKAMHGRDSRFVESIRRYKLIASLPNILI